MALPISPPDLALLRAGAKVRLRGDAKPQPRKPYPVGWVEVAETNTVDDFSPLQFIRVVGDERWLPVELIEEIALP